LFTWPVLLGALAGVFVAAPWYIAMIKVYGASFIQEFFVNDHIRRVFVAEHSGNDRWFFYPLTMALCLFPWCLYSVPAFFRGVRGLKPVAEPFGVFIFSWVLGTFLVFQFAHSKLVSYIFPVIPALAIVTGSYLSRAVEERQGRSFVVLGWLTVVVLVVFSIGTYFAAGRFPEYLTPKIQRILIGYIAVQLAAVILMGRFLMRGAFVNFLLVLGLQVPLLLSVAFSGNSEYDAFVSSEKACARLKELTTATGTVLCSKMFARGVRYYTDWDVAVVNVGGSDYFSPHPVPYLDTHEKLRAFFMTQPVTYGIVRRSNAIDIERSLAGTDYSLERLAVVGDEHLVRIRQKEAA
jgi:4-amino-4-deoxy-L-arabinose transferase-like glycosyltransferase